MKKTLNLQIKSFSINSMYNGGSSSKGKTRAAKEWTYQVFFELSKSENKQVLKELREAFNPEENYYSISLIYLFPRKKLFTKENQISSSSHDLSNIEKPLIDCIFLPKHFKEEPPFGAENLNIDDKYICELVSKKMLSNDEEHYAIVDIEIKDLTAIDQQ